MRFLIVDDSRAVQSLLRRTILETGLPDLEFEVAEDGRSALELVGSWRPDMVITDWHMPGMSGIELLKNIRERHSSDLKVGFVTTESSRESLQEAKKYGALFVLNKPFQPEDFMDLINNAVREPVEVAGQARSSAVYLAENIEISTALERALKQKVKIEPASPESIGTLRLPAHVSICSLGQTGEILGLCLLDFSSLTTIGGTLLEKPLVELQKAQVANVPGPEWVERVTALLTHQLPGYYKNSGEHKVRLAKSQVIRQAGPQLQEIFRRCSSRRDFLVKRADLPTGRLTLLGK